MSFKDQQDVCAVAAQARIPVIKTGRQGSGKTTWTDTTMPMCGYPKGYTLIGSILEPSDFIGIPVRVEEEGIFKYLPPESSKVLAQPDSFLHLDELNRAPIPVQNAMLRLVNEGYMGEVKLRCYITASVNPPTTSAGANELSEAMNDRWMWVDWKQTSTEYTAGLRSQWKGTGRYKPPMLPGNWRDNFQFWCETVADFLDGHQDLIAKDNPHAWPPVETSERTWFKFLIPWMCAAQAAGLNKTQTQLGAAGCIGVGPAITFMAALKVGGGFRELIDNPRLIKTKLKGKDPDVISSFLDAVNESWKDGVLEEAKLAQIYDYAIKADLPADWVYAAFSKVRDQGRTDGTKLSSYVISQVDKTITSRF